MSTNFPTALDALTNPAATDVLTGHAAQHSNANDAIEALQAKVGVNSSAVATSLDYKVSALESSRELAANKGVAGGYASLDGAGKVPAAQLPSYVDDVLEYANLAGFPVTGEPGKIYVAEDTNKTYRWSGSAYIFITSGAVDSVNSKTGVVSLVKADVGLGNVDNTSDLDKPISIATQTALNLKEDKSSKGAANGYASLDASGKVPTTQLPSYVASVSGKTGAVTLVKGDVGLGSVDNTSDANKPVSTAQQAALNTKANLSGAAFTGASSITANSASNALTITQTGTGNALVVEDSASPDATPFVIDGVGNVGISVTPTANTSSGLFLSKDISFTGSNNALMGNIYFDGDWKYFGNGTGAYIKLAGSSTSAIEIGYADNNSSGTGAVANVARAIILNNVGGVGIGGDAAAAGQSVNVMKDMTGATTSLGIVSRGNVRSDVTSQARYFQSFANTQATTFSLSDMLHYLAEQGTFGAGSTVINQYGFYASSALTGAINNYGFFSGIPSGTGRYNFYAAGTAANYFAGSTGIGMSPTSGQALSVSGTAGASNFVIADQSTGAAGTFGFINGNGPGVIICGSASFGAGQIYFNNNTGVVQTAASGLGYGTGAGGTVTQATSKSTAVTLNKPTGQITMHNAALAAGAEVGFGFNNSVMTSTDMLLVAPKGALGAAYSTRVVIGTAGASIYVKNITADSLSDAVILNFAIIKGSVS